MTPQSPYGSDFLNITQSFNEGLIPKPFYVHISTTLNDFGPSEYRPCL